MQQILIVGAGSVGGFFGAHLVKAGLPVSFLLRPGTLRAVQQNGLTVRSAQGSFTVHPSAASDPSELPIPDLILLSVKAYDVDAALTQIEPILREQTVLLTLQNGVDTEDRIIKRFQRDCVVGGVAFIYATIATPGVIDHYKKGTVMIGEMMGHQSARVLAIADLFNRAGIPCQVTEDVRRRKWEKMCWNCVFNPLTVLINDKVAKALDQPEMVSVIAQIVGEVVAVAATMKVPLAPNMVEQVVRWSQEIRDIHTSMYDDWKAGRPTEIDFLNGYIGQVGRTVGIPTPMNDLLTATIKALTACDRTGPGILRIDGAVLQPVSWDGPMLAAFAAPAQLDLAMVMPGIQGKGVRLSALLAIPALAPTADHVTILSGDGQYAVCLTLADAMAFGVVVYELDGAPLLASKGGPFRLVTPGLGDVCAHVKNVARIEITIGPGADTRPSVART